MGIGPPSHCRVCLAVDFAGCADFRQHGAGDIEDGQQFVVPVEHVDVEDQRAACVAEIRDMPFAAGEPPQEPRIDGAEEDLAPLGAAAEPFVAVQQVLDLRAGEIGVQEQAGLRPKGRFEPLGFQPLADRRAGPALPNHGMGDRSAGMTVPENCRFALIGDPDRGNPLGRQRRLGHGLPGHVELRRPKDLGIVLHDARRRQNLRKLLLRRGHDPAAVIEHDRAAGRGPLIQG